METSTHVEKKPPDSNNTGNRNNARYTNNGKIAMPTRTHAPQVRNYSTKKIKMQQ